MDGRTNFISICLRILSCVLIVSVFPGDLSVQGPLCCVPNHEGDLKTI